MRKELETIIGMGYRSHRVFEDWVGLMFHAFQRDDPPYLEIMGGYRNTAPRGQREADHFATATACLLEYMRATNEEVLGPLYEEYAANHYTGPVFHAVRCGTAYGQHNAHSAAGNRPLQGA